LRSPIYPFAPDPVVAALMATMGMAWVLRAPRKAHGPRVNIFDVPEDEWEREAAGYRAILAAEDAK
jgi:hypothetical protein